MSKRRMIAGGIGSESSIPPCAKSANFNVTPVPLRRGSVLFMTRRTKHASLSNQSDEIRWSFDVRYNPIGQPSGRPAFPGFAARSRSNPASVLSDPLEWADLWYATRARLAREGKPIFNRWVDSPEVCA